MRDKYILQQTYFTQMLVMTTRSLCASILRHVSVKLYGEQRIVDSNLTYASLMTLAYLRQSPVTWHTPITLETAYTWLTLALAGFRVAGVGHAAESVATA